jgi:hypothetical protein
MRAVSSRQPAFPAAQRHSSHIRRLSKSTVGRRLRPGTEGSALLSVSRASISARNRGGSAFVEDSDERRAANQGRDTAPSNEGVADAGTLPVAREGLLQSKMHQELPLLDP